MKLLRKLGYMEARMHYMQSKLCGTTQGTLALRIKGPLNLERLERSIKRVADQFEILNAVISETEQGLYFSTSENYRHNIDRSNYSGKISWIDYFKQEVEKPLEANNSLWRILIVSLDSPNHDAEIDIFITLHHAIADGTAADSFIDSIFETYNENVNTAKPSIAPITLSAEERMSSTFGLSWQDFISYQQTILRTSTSDLLSNHVEHIAIEKRHSDFECVTLSEETVCALDQFCNEQSIPLNSLLSAALIKSVCDVSRESQSVSFFTTFSLRRLCNASPDDIGCFISVIPTRFDRKVDCADYVELMKTHNQRLSKAILNSGKLPIDYPFVDLREKTEALRSNNIFSCDIAYTYGRSNVKEVYGDIKVLHLFPAVNRSLGNIGIAVHSTRINDKIFLTCCRTSPSQDPEWAKAVTRRFSELTSKGFVNCLRREAV